MVHPPIDPREENLMIKERNVFFFFDLRGVSGPAYAHHDYSPRPTEHPASPGAGKAPRG